MSGRVCKGGRDAGSFAAELKQLYGDIAVDPSEGPLDWRLDCASAGQVQMVRVALSRPWSCSRTVRGQIGLLAPQEGSCRAIFGDRTATASPGQALLIQSGMTDRLEMIPAAGFASVSLIMDKRLFFRVLGSTVDPAQPYDFGLVPVVDLTTGPGQLLKGFINTLVTGLSDESVVLSSPLSISLTAEALARLILQTLPNRLGDPPGRPHAAGLPRPVRSAVEFMAANLQRPITTLQVAAAAETSIRSLEQAFQKVLKTTPMAYFRKLRLEAVRSEIRLRGGATSIADIARAYGFGHLGRFAAYYKAEFGELPSETVYSARRSD